MIRGSAMWAIQGVGSLGILCVVPSAAAAQSWRLRLDTQADMAAFRGVELDSVPASAAITGPTGGPISPDSLIARCPPGSAFCYVFRQGTIQRGGPATATIDLTFWGLGVPGLRARTQARLGIDLGRSDVWPGVEPAAQLVEGYLEYATSAVTGRLGRQLVSTSLGWTGFDGGQVVGRADRLGLEGDLYAGLGLGYATALPVTSPVLNPLDEFQPRRRQLLAGAAVAWRGARADVRLDYQREVDRQSRQFWSERLALSADWQIAPRWILAGTSEYDLAAGWFGTSDVSARYSSRTMTSAVGVRRYRPFFPLWTIWGAFSPVPYHAVYGSASAIPFRSAQFRVSTERFRYSAAEAATPLVQVDNDGWRTSVGANYQLSHRWTLDAGYWLDYGPGASADGWDGSMTFRPDTTVTVTAYGAILNRPLEFRFSESDVRAWGLDAAWQASPRLRIALGGAVYAENRERPDAAGFAWNQLRLHARVSWLFSSDPDPTPLPPAIRRHPAAGTPR